MHSNNDHRASALTGEIITIVFGPSARVPERRHLLAIEPHGCFAIHQQPFCLQHLEKCRSWHDEGRGGLLAYPYLSMWAAVRPEMPPPRTATCSPFLHAIRQPLGTRVRWTLTCEPNHGLTKLQGLRFELCFRDGIHTFGRLIDMMRYHRMISCYNATIRWVGFAT